MIVYEYDLDMVPGLTQGRTVVSLSQYDDNFFINFHLYTRNGSFVIESGTTARIRGTKPDGNGFSATATVDASDMTVLVEGDKQMTAAAGTSQYELTLMKGTKELNTANFDVYIERAALDIDTPASETKLRELYDLPVDEILQAATTAVDAKDDAEDARDAAIAAKDEAVSVTDGLMEIVRGSFIYETASGSVASFSDGGDGLPVKSAVVNVDPVQDLHGYDHPWAGGAGKNLLPLSIFSNTNMFTVNDDGSVTQKTDDGRSESFMPTFHLKAGTYTFSTSIVSGMHYLYYRSGNSFVACIDRSTATSDTFTLSEEQDLYFKASVNGTYPVTMKMQIESGSTATAWTPYSNICPITGHTSAMITRAGKNLLPMTVDSIKANNGGASSWNGNSKTISGVTFTINTDNSGNVISITANGTSSDAWLLLASFTYAANISYVINGSPVGGSVYTYGVESDNLNMHDIGSGVTILQTSDYTDNIYVYVKNGITINNAVFKPMIRLASDTDPTYEPYQGHVYNVTFPGSAGTVYGGTLDPVHGTLWVNKAYFKPTSYINNNINEFSVSVSAIAPSAIAGNLTFVSNMMTAGYRDQNNVQSKKLVCFRGGISDHKELAIAGDITLYPTNDALKAALADAEFVYELETPVRYSAMIDEDEITTLLGINHVWADTGDVSIDYAADPKLYINKVIANALNA